MKISAEIITIVIACITFMWFAVELKIEPLEARLCVYQRLITENQEEIAKLKEKLHQAIILIKVKK